MSYVKLPFQPGVYKDDSPLQSKGYWIDVNKIRFVRGLPETLYGQEKASTAMLLGIARGGITYADNSRNPYAVFGTNLRLYAMDVDGNVTDITPGITYARTTVNLTTVISTSTVEAAWTGHGLVADQKFSFANVTVSTVGGVSTAGTFVVASTSSANTVTFNSGGMATSSAGPTGVTADSVVFLAPGQVDGLGGFGYGTGGFGSGGYSGSASGVTLYPRTWALSNWGQNAIANPRGGGIYELAPYTTTVELTTNGDFSAATGWTQGSGWVIGGGVASCNECVSSLTQMITLDAGAWHKLQYTITSNTKGTVQASVANVNTGSANSTANTYFSVVYGGGGGAQTLSLTAAGSATLTLDNVSFGVLPYANIITNAPTQVTCSFVTSERILVACGCADTSSNFDAMRVRWTDTQNNQTWTASAANLAGSYTLSNGSRIVRGLPGSSENTIHTDTALYAMVYNGDPTSVYSFPERGSGCGLIGPNAVCQVGGITYWMDPNGGFWGYSGSFPYTIPCTLARDVFDNLAWVQQDKIYAFPMTTKGRIEIYWLIPDSRDGTECSRYISYQVTASNESGKPVWTNGTFDRTTWINGGVFQYPLAVDSTGAIYFQEKGFTDNGAARSWSATTAFFDMADDGTHNRLLAIQPDAEDLQGNYTITINSRINSSSGAVTRTFGPYNITQAKAKLSLRANGEQIQLVFAGNSAPSFWRMGAYRYDIQKSGRTR